jgi:serine/threonine protein phosphatase 1
MHGRTVVIGDVHGCDRALRTLLDALAPQADDLFVQLGDVIDRGPGTRQCIEQLLELRQTCRLVHLMGNHEEMFLDALAGGRWTQSWLEYGGREMLASYGGGIGAVPQAHCDFIRAGKDYFETARDILVHGNLRPQVPVDQEQAQWLRWARFQPTTQRHVSGKRVICGHTAQAEGTPAGNADYLCLDTCAYCARGALSALELGTDVFWQATQSGELREGRPLSEVLPPA